VAGNKALIYAHLLELTQPSHDTTFDARGRKGYVRNARVRGEGRRNLPEAPPGTRASEPQAGDQPALPDQATFPITVERTKEIFNGGMRVEATGGNVQGVGNPAATLAIQCKGCDRHPGVENDDEFITVAEDYNQSPVYAQAGLVATVNEPQPGVEWRAVVSNVVGVVHFNVVFTNGPASASGDTGGGPAPEQRAYDVANTDYFDDLNGFMPEQQDFRPINPRAVINGRQSLDDYDTIALADDALPGYTGPYGRRIPAGPKTGDVDLSDSIASNGGGSGAPGTFVDKEFTIGPNDANRSLTARIEWENELDDFDLYLFRKEGDEEVEVGSSAGGPPSNSESFDLDSPEPGDYVARINRYASGSGDFTGNITFARLRTGPGETGDYNVDERAVWLGELAGWVRRGGNLVLTDGALQALKEITEIPPAAVGGINVYAGQSAFAKADDEPTTDDPLARDVVQQGARFGSGMRRQMFEPTPLGFAIQDASGGDFSASPQWHVDRAAWEQIGGRTVATSISSSASSPAAVFDRTTIGELKMGQGQVRFAGALLPQPTEAYDHEFGLEPYATTYTGYIIARNLLDAGRTRGGGSGGGGGGPRGGEPGKDTLGGRFIISRQRVRLRPRALARVKVRCRHRRGCRGRLHLRVKKRLRLRRDGERVRGKRLLVEVGQKRFRYRRARRAVIPVRLTLEGRKLIRRRGRLRIRAFAPVRFGDGRGGVAKRRFAIVRRARR
jgi:hypothetical protein